MFHIVPFFVPLIVPSRSYILDYFERMMKKINRESVKGGIKK